MDETFSPKNTAVTNTLNELPSGRENYSTAVKERKDAAVVILLMQEMVSRLLFHSQDSRVITLC